MKYDRKIRYIDYIENGQRLRNGGFVKLELRDGGCYISIQISGLHCMENSMHEVYVLADGREETLDKIQLRQGKGSLQLHRDSESLSGGICYDELKAIRIPIATGRELYCKIAENVVQNRQPEEERKPVRLSLKEPVNIEMWERIAESERKEKQAGDSTETEREEKQTGENSEIEGKEKQAGDSIETEREEKQTSENSEIEGKEMLTAESTQPVGREKMHGEKAGPELLEEAIERSIEPMQQKGIPLMEDKWKQLSAVYPHITPFQDDRDYLSIGPGDFVIFTQQYYKLVNNSFLLHGYYNYKHLILTRMTRKNEIVYYIGVPGNFYEREKQVAIMFGFESFECREEPAVNGEYGYYMMRVEI